MSDASKFLAAFDGSGAGAAVAKACASSEPRGRTPWVLGDYTFRLAAYDIPNNLKPGELGVTLHFKVESAPQERLIGWTYYDRCILTPQTDEGFSYGAEKLRFMASKVFPDAEIPAPDDVEGVRDLYAELLESGMGTLWQARLGKSKNPDFPNCYIDKLIEE